MTEPLFNGTQQLNGKHRRFLNSEQKFLAIHHQNTAGAECSGVAEAAMILGDKGPCSKNIASLNLFNLTIITPAELNAAIKQAEHAIARLPGTENGLACGDLKNLALAGQGAHGVECVQDCFSEMKMIDIFQANPSVVNG
jgi:hypothetical protein